MSSKESPLVSRTESMAKRKTNSCYGRINRNEEHTNASKERSSGTEGAASGTEAVDSNASGSNASGGNGSNASNASGSNGRNANGNNLECQWRTSIVSDFLSKHVEMPIGVLNKHSADLLTSSVGHTLDDDWSHDEFSKFSKFSLGCGGSSLESSWQGRQQYGEGSGEEGQKSGYFSDYFSDCGSDCCSDDGGINDNGTNDNNINDNNTNLSSGDKLTDDDDDNGSMVNEVRASVIMSADSAMNSYNYFGLGKITDGRNGGELPMARREDAQRGEGWIVGMNNNSDGMNNNNNYGMISVNVSDTEEVLSKSVPGSPNNNKNENNNHNVTNRSGNNHTFNPNVTDHFNDPPSNGIITTSSGGTVRSSLRTVTLPTQTGSERAKELRIRSNKRCSSQPAAGNRRATNMGLAARELAHLAEAQAGLVTRVRSRNSLTNDSNSMNNNDNKNILDQLVTQEQLNSFWTSEEGRGLGVELHVSGIQNQNIADVVGNSGALFSPDVDEPENLATMERKWRILQGEPKGKATPDDRSSPPPVLDPRKGEEERDSEPNPCAPTGSSPTDNTAGRRLLLTTRESLSSQYKFVAHCSKGSKSVCDTSPNQDNFSYTICNGWHLIVVMDGHGLSGHEVSSRCVRTLPYYLVRSPHFRANCKEANCKEEGSLANSKEDGSCCDPGDSASVKAALRSAFSEVSKDLLTASVEEGFDVQGSGSTCVLFMYKGDTVYTANVGDSRLFVAYEKDDDLDEEDEKKGRFLGKKKPEEARPQLV